MFFIHYFSNSNPEEEVSTSNIDGFRANYISKSKWVWQAQFLFHTLVILKNSVFFEDKQMILVSFFDIFTGFRFPKNLKSLHIQFLSHPWVIEGREVVKIWCQNLIFRQKSPCLETWNGIMSKVA